MSRIFAADQAVDCLVLHRPGAQAHLGLLTRGAFYRAMTGRFGYGYSLFAKRSIAELADWTPFVVASGDHIEGVTAIVLGQPRESRPENVAVRWPDGSLGTIRVTDLFEAIAGLYGHDALHDGLTGLPNRVLFRDRLQVALDGLGRGGHTVAVILMDLDHFKHINDTLGHAAGDEVLLSFARRVRALMRPGDSLARLGGDEFAVLVADLKAAADAMAVASRIIESLTDPFDAMGQQLRFGASLGVATATEPTSADVMLRDADLAMYEAKRERRGGARVFEPVMHIEAVQQLQLDNDLNLAIQHDELSLVYQPQVALDGRCIGLEALVRWNHPVHGALHPASFVARAEMSELIIDLDAWVCRRACAAARGWAEPLRVCVNVSNRTLDSGRLVPIVGDALVDAGLPADRLEIEITERVAANDLSRGPETLAELRRWGVRVAMDDFGTGYSSLSRLSAFPIDTIKVDRSFVARLGEVSSVEGIIRAIIAMAGALGMSVVAEGVETRAQLEFLASCGCDVVQGYLLGRPVTAEQVESAVGAARAAAITLRHH